MAETLLSASNVLLYGRVLQDLMFTFVDPDTKDEFAPEPPPRRLGANRFLQDQLQVTEAGAPHLARIYAFSYEGHYYDLPKPAIFLVHGPGDDPEATRPGEARVSRAPADVDRTGVARPPASFSEDMRVWSYDKGDFSIRLDVETGPLEDILLENRLREQATHAPMSGSKLHLRGASGLYGKGHD